MFDFFKGTVTPQDWTFVGVVVGVAVALAAAFYFVVHQRQVDQLATAISDVRAIDAQLKEAQQIESEFDAFRIETEKMEELVQRFEDRLPEERDIQRLIGQFEEQGSQLGLLVELEPQEKLTDANKETYPYKVLATGDYHDIVTFINLFERDDRYIKVSDLYVKEQKIVSGRPVTEATFTLSTFVFRQETTPAATGGA